MTEQSYILSIAPACSELITHRNNAPVFDRPEPPLVRLLYNFVQTERDLLSHSRVLHLGSQVKSYFHATVSKAFDSTAEASATIVAPILSALSTQNVALAFISVKKI